MQKVVYIYIYMYILVHADAFAAPLCARRDDATTTALAMLQDQMRLLEARSALLAKTTSP